MYDWKACFKGGVNYQHTVQRKKCGCGWQWWEVDKRKLLQVFWETQIWKLGMAAGVLGRRHYKCTCEERDGGENERELGVKQWGGFSCLYSGVIAEKRQWGSSSYGAACKLHKPNDVNYFILFGKQVPRKCYKVVENNVPDRKHFEYIVSKISL